MEQLYSECPVNINKLNTQGSKSFHIYPNPTKDYIVVEYQNANNSQRKDCKVYNIQGQIVMQFKIQTSSIRISTENWKNGIYFVQIGSEIQKLVVE